MGADGKPLYAAAEQLHGEVHEGRLKHRPASRKLRAGELPSLLGINRCL